jgi:hypothetical protein
MLITFTPKRVLFFLGLIVACLVVANLALVVAQYVFHHDTVFGLVPLFSLDREHNVPAGFSSLLLLLCSGLLGIIMHAKKRQGEKDSLYWLGLAASFLFLSFDELFMMHERLVIPVRAAVHATGLLYFAWVIPYGIGVSVLALVYLHFLLRLPASVRHLTVGAGVIYVTGALGFELLAGAYFEEHRTKDLVFAMLATCEETLEMGGALLFLYALMTYIDAELGNLYFRVASSPEPSLPLPRQQACRRSK